MEKSINTLLNSNLRVIIPDFGAFIIRQKEPRIVVFNEFLRYNDGILIGYVAKSEGIDLEIAEQLVNEYSSNISKMLESGKSYTFEGLGSLIRDNSGKIIFESEINSKVTEPSQDAEPEFLPSEGQGDKPLVIEEAGPLIVKKGRPKKSAPAKSPVKKAAKRAVKKGSTVRKKTARPAPVRQDKPLTEPAQGAKTPDKIPIITGQPQAQHEIPIPSLSETVNRESDQPEVRQPLVHDLREEQMPYNQTRLIFRWVAIIVVANAAILAWFIFGEKIRDRSREKKSEAGIMDSVYQHLSDSVRAAATDTTLIFRETPEIIVPDTTTAGASLRYYIVAGCFRDEINADELVKSLQNEGFKAEKFGKIGNLYAVSFASFEDKEMAVSELERIRDEIHPEAWMTRF